MYPGSPFERKYFAALLLNHLLDTWESHGPASSKWSPKYEGGELDSFVQTSMAGVQVFDSGFAGSDSCLAFIGRACSFPAPRLYQILPPSQPNAKWGKYFSFCQALPFLLRFFIWSKLQRILLIRESMHFQVIGLWGQRQANNFPHEVHASRRDCGYLGSDKRSGRSDLEQTP